jgi:hydroxymethylpyrimidine/phosphomethylpyrimidine kinase
MFPEEFAKLYYIKQVAVFIHHPIIIKTDLGIGSFFMQYTVLTIGRLDPTGSSGILKDIRTITELGGYGRAVASFCLSPGGVRQVYPLPTELVCEQMSGLVDLSVKCIKIGNLVGSDMMDKVADFIEGPGKNIPLILEPVMTSGRNLDMVLDHDAIQAFERRLFLHATILCPNITEAYRITGRWATDLESMIAIAQMLMTLGNKAVLLTGGSLAGDCVYDVFVDEDHEEIFSSQRVLAKSSAGTGDALTAAIACGLAQGKDLRHSVIGAREYVQKLIRHEFEEHDFSGRPQNPAFMSQALQKK